MAYIVSPPVMAPYSDKLYYEHNTKEVLFLGHPLVDLELLLRECSNRGISLTEVIGAVRAIAPR